MDKLNQELDSFSVTLNKKHYDAALQVRDEIKANNFEEPSMKVHTMDIYKKSFTFPQIAHNDYAVEQFDALNVAEQNLNADPQSESQMESFLKTADEVANNLKDRYKEQWVDPKDDRNTSSEWEAKAQKWVKNDREFVQIKTRTNMRDKDRINNIKVKYSVGVQ